MGLSTATDRFTATDLDRLASDLARDGICVIEGLLDPALVDEWAQAFDALFRERQAREGALAPREQERYYLTLPWVPPFANEEVFGNPVVLGVLERVLGQGFKMVQLGADTPLKGSDYQEIHRDYAPLFGDELVTPLYALAVNFPLVDVVPENGPLDLARGTHVLTREEGLRRIEAGDIKVEQFLMKRGDVSIRTPLCLHRGTPNRTQSPRPMVVMGYVRHWLHTPEVNLTIPRAYYETLSETTRAMLRCTVVDELPQDAQETYVKFKF